MSEAITAVITAILTFAAQELRQRIKAKKTSSTTPPPPESDFCKHCFFFKHFKRTVGRCLTDSDTTIVRIYRGNGKADD